MATTGGYYIEVKGLDELIAACKGMRGYTKDLKAVHSKIVRRAVVDVKRHAPMGKRSPKDSKTHKPPGTLKRRVYGKSTPRRAAVGVHDPGGYLILQEFGGTSFWHRGGAGAIRAVNRAHAALSTYDEASGKHIANVRVGGKGHVVYHKKRKPRGYFIWNEAYHLRHFIAQTYVVDLATFAKKYDLPVKVNRGASLDLEPMDFYGRSKEGPARTYGWTGTVNWPGRAA